LQVNPLDDNFGAVQHIELADQQEQAGHPTQHATSDDYSRYLGRYVAEGISGMFIFKVKLQYSSRILNSENIPIFFQTRRFLFLSKAIIVYSLGDFFYCNFETKNSTYSVFFENKIFFPERSKLIASLHCCEEHLSDLDTFCSNVDFDFKTMKKFQ
jgi:hypothetical protein